MESDRLYRGKTRECWIQRLEEIRKRYQKYRAILEDHLKEQGIILKPAYTDGLDETGRPWGLRIIGKRGIEKMLPLRKDEYALYLFDVGDGVLAFPDNGIGRKSALHSGCERWKALYYGIPESLRTPGRIPPALLPYRRV